MSMSHSEAGRMSRHSTQQAEIGAYAAQYRPKMIREYWENGYKVTVWEPAVADGAEIGSWIKPTGRSGSYEI